MDTHIGEAETPTERFHYYNLTLAFELSEVAYLTCREINSPLHASGRSKNHSCTHPGWWLLYVHGGVLTKTSTMESDPMVQGVDQHSRMSSPLDAAIIYLPRWLQPFFRVLQPHIDAVLRLAVVILDDIAQQLAPLLHQAVAAASPYLQVSRCNPGQGERKHLN